MLHDKIKVFAKKYLASEPYILLYASSGGIYLTTMPQILMMKSCHMRFNDSVCNMLGNDLYKSEETQVYHAVTKWNTIIIAATFLVSMLCIMPFGALSDIVSKKKLMLFPPIACILQSLILVLSIKLKIKALELLVVAACVTGLCGDFLGTLTLASSYIADATSDGSARTARMIAIGFCTYAGHGLGAFFSGIISKNYDFAYPFILSISLSFVNVVYVLLILPEVSLSNLDGIQNEDVDSLRKDGRCRQVIDIAKQTLVNIYSFVKKYSKNMKGEGKEIWFLIFAYFFTIISLGGENTIIILYVKHTPLSFSSYLVGLYILSLMVVRGVGGLFSLLIMRWLRVNDGIVAIVGFFGIIGTYISMALSTSSTELFGCTSFSLTYSLTLPAIRSSLTKRVSSSEYGTALFFTAFFSMTGNIIMIFSINILFDRTARIFHGTAMLFLAGCSFIGMLFAITVSLIDYRKSTVETPSSQTEESVKVLKRSPSLEEAPSSSSKEQKQHLFCESA